MASLAALDFTASKISARSTHIIRERIDAQLETDSALLGLPRDDNGAQKVHEFGALQPQDDGWDDLILTLSAL